MTRTACCCLLVASIFAVSGCGAEATSELSGTVTFENELVKKGNVSLDPVEGDAPTIGGPIKDGKYTVKNVKRGIKYRVFASGEPEGTAGMSQEEVNKLSQEELDRRSQNPIPDDAQGNNMTVEIKEANQAFDVKLTKKR